jgi:tRNA(Met) C34 N-acetyltransferase TmcA
MKQLKKMAQRGLLDPEQEDPFSLFVASTNIRYCYYNETQNILGNTYGMAVLQVSSSDSNEQAGILQDKYSGKQSSRECCQGPASP